MIKKIKNLDHNQIYAIVFFLNTLLKHTADLCSTCKAKVHFWMAAYKDNLHIHSHILLKKTDD